MNKAEELRRSLITVSRQMRRNPTTGERYLWTFLRKRQIAGFKFRRQHIIQTSIVDFYCSRARLVVEVDGEIHQLSRQYDQDRDGLLESQGYKILRFTNEQVFSQTKEILSMILDALVKT